MSSHLFFTTPMSLTNIYILRLQGGKFYVGKSGNVMLRYQQHLNGIGSAWTKKYKPISLVRTIEKASPFDEDKYTKEYMAKYGIENVRGGSYTAVDLSEEQEDTLRNELRSASDCCLKCGKPGHFANQCKKKTSFAGTCGCGKKFLVFEEFLSHQKMCLPRNRYEESEEDSDESKDIVICYRCGREGHYASRCYASRHIRGYYLR